ncbi:MAG: PPA1309 family protein, partial [Sciscionella sp.]
PLTPVAQEQLPDTDLAEALAGIAWPDTVGGCAITQEILVLPPEAEKELAAQQSDTDADDAWIRQVAAEHPQRREARLVAAVLRDGPAACVLRLRETDEQPEQIVEHPELAPNLTQALLRTLQP